MMAVWSISVYQNGTRLNVTETNTPNFLNILFNAGRSIPVNNLMQIRAIGAHTEGSNGNYNL